MSKEISFSSDDSDPHMPNPYREVLNILKRMTPEDRTFTKWLIEMRSPGATQK